MKEILFRGKRKDNGEWVEGYLVNARYYLDNSLTAMIIFTDVILYPRCEVNEWEEVIPETVGQYTGLTDKNGKKIFEGDIVEIPLFVSCEEPTVAVVVWNGLYANFGLEAKNVKTDFYYYFGDEMKVIGNLHDNPDLLKGGAE